MIDKHTISFVGYIKRNVLIRLLCTGSAVLIPDIDTLTVLDIGGESLAETVDQFPYAE